MCLRLGLGLVLRMTLGLLQIWLRSGKASSVSQYSVQTSDTNALYLCVADGPPLSWWVGGPGVGQVQTYWGGAPPGSQQCACGLQENCVDPKHHCNCDADLNEWYCIYLYQQHNKMVNHAALTSSHD